MAYWTYEPVRTTPETRTILVIHGFRGDHHGLLRVADQLPEMRLIMPDLPGFGSSEAFADGEHSVRAVRAVHRRLHGGARPGAGHGPAGPLVRIHRRQPTSWPTIRSAVRPLILINPIAAPALEGPKGLMTRLAVLYYRLAARLPRRMGLQLLRSRLIVRVMSVAMAKTKDKELLPVHPRAAQRLLQRVRQPREPAGILHRHPSAAMSQRWQASCALPVLLVAGEKDEIALLP